MQTRGGGAGWKRQAESRLNIGWCFEPICECDPGTPAWNNELERALKGVEPEKDSLFLLCVLSAKPQEASRESRILPLLRNRRS